MEDGSLEFVFAAMTFLGLLLLVQLNQLQALATASPDDKSRHTFLVQPGSRNSAGC